MDRLDLKSLCLKHHNEEAHAARAAEFSLQLFDACRDALNLSEADRALLEAAARLHDIGYYSDPANHAAVGAKIVLQEGLPDLDDVQRGRVAALILLHHKHYGDLENHEVLMGTGEGLDQVKRLAAVLRIADALDYGHIQDSEITAVKCDSETVRIHVACRALAGCLDQAVRKADLWREVCPLGIAFKQVRKKVFLQERGVLLAENSAEESARRVLFYAYGGIRDNRAGAMEGASTDPLHDLRVAIRRFRAGLRLFKPMLPNTAVESFDASLGQLGDDLSPYRDTDAWLEIIREPGFHKKFADDPEWKMYFKKIQQDHLVQQPQVQLILGNENCRSLLYRLDYALRIELPDALRTQASIPVPTYGANVMLRTARRITRLNISGMEAQDEKIHELRKRCRRARYWAEFLTPVLGPVTGELADYFKRIAGDLGMVHDMDVHLERLHAEHLPVPKKLFNRLIRLRKKSWQDFQHSWDDLRDKRFTQRLKKELKAAGKA